jgi:aspartate/methionine/tyrosine aminotransferase
MSLQCLYRRINLEGRSFFGYAPSPGRPEIRTVWKDMLLKKNPSLASLSMSQPIVTSALTHGLSMAGYLFLDKNDKIIIPDQYWENYELVFNHPCGSTMEKYDTFTSEGGYNIDGLEKTLMAGAPGKKVVLLNFPNNPTGYTPTFAEAQAIQDVLLKAADAGNELVVFIDDAYFGLVFENGIITESMFTMLAGLHERILAVKFDGPTKEDYVWGFRVGFVTFGVKGGTPALYQALENKLAGAIRGNISNASNVGQSLLLAAYTDETYENEKIEKFAILKRRYEKIRHIFAHHPEYADFFTPLPFNSGYFMCIRMTEGDPEIVRQILLKDYSTGVIVLGDVMRIAFSATPYDMLEKLFENIYNAARDARKV